MIHHFTYSAPVTLRVGRNILQQHKETLRDYGQRAFIITSRFAPGFRNYGLEDLTAIFDELGTAYVIDDSVEENPSVESVARIAEHARSFSPDFMVAIGGGSALDTGKAVNILLGHSADCDAYSIFYQGCPCKSGAKSQGKLPLIGMPTTAGSGSEVAGYAVLTRTDLKTKLRMDPLSFFTEAFLDARYIEQSPQWLLDAGALDALAHGLESSFNVSNNPTSQMLADAGFALFSDYKDAMLNERLFGEDFDKMLLAAALQGMAVSQSSTTLPHVMGYPLTHEKGLPHGFASCVCLVEYLHSFREPAHREKVKDLLKKCGFSCLEELDEFLQTIISRNAQFRVTQQEIEQWTDEVYCNKPRLERHPEPISKETLREIFSNSLKYKTYREKIVS